MEISIVLGFIITIMFLMSIGVLSLQKPDIAGADFYWSKYKWFYIPKYKKATNKYYEHQLKVVGVGLVGAAVVLLVLMAFYIIYPPIVVRFFNVR